MKHEEVMIKVPEGLEFSSLALHIDPVFQVVTFDPKPISAICEASGIDSAIFREMSGGNGSNVFMGVIVAWYKQHLQAGGARDAVCEQLFAEVLAEDQFGKAAVHPAAPNKQ